MTPCVDPDSIGHLTLLCIVGLLMILIVGVAIFSIYFPVALSLVLYDKIMTAVLLTLL